MPLPTLLKEVLHELTTGIFQHTRRYLGLGVVRMGGVEGITALDIGGTIDHTVYL